jgi:hypothetical protein
MLPTQMTKVGRTVLQIISAARTNYGHNYAACKVVLAQWADVDPESLDDSVLDTAMKLGRDIIARRAGRPEYFHIVTTGTGTEKLLAMIWTRTVQTTGDLELLSVYTGTALRQKLEALHPNATSMILSHLSAATDKDPAFDQVDLVKIWPKYNEKR